MKRPIATVFAAGLVAVCIMGKANLVEIMLGGLVISFILESFE